MRCVLSLAGLAVSLLPAPSVVAHGMTVGVPVATTVARYALLAPCATPAPCLLQPPAASEAIAVATLVHGASRAVATESDMLVHRVLPSVHRRSHGIARPVWR